MKSKIKKLWGLGLIVTVLASLLVAAVPVAAAEPLTWNAEALPGAGGNVLASSTDIVDIAVAADGETLYAAIGGTTNVTYKSTNGGATWSSLNVAVSSTGISPDLVAVAPDDADLVAVCDISADTIYVSSNGGATWGTLSAPTNVGAIASIDISAYGEGANHLWACGTDNGSAAGVWYYKLGLGGSWTDVTAGDSGGNDLDTLSQTYALAVMASPNFASDLTVLCVTANNTGAYLNLYSRNLGEWNDDAAVYGNNYPVLIEAGTAFDSATATAAIATAPTYLGGDEVERVAFVALSDGSDGGGLFRTKDTNEKDMQAGVDMLSVAYDGATLVAGEDEARTVWRCSDPLDSSPTLYQSASTKSPGGTKDPVVAWAGSTVVAGTYGASSCFSVSEDDGASFTDISLIDNALTTISDVAVADDGSVVYLSTDDGTDLSIWRYDGSWGRVLNVLGDTGYYLRISPDDPDVLYVVASGASNLYYTKTGGNTKWYSRTAPSSSPNDLAVESEAVAYIEASGMVRKTENGGFTWGTPTDAKVTPYCLTGLGEDMVLVGGTGGDVSYSTDGGSSFSLIPQTFGSTGNVVVTADGLEEGSNIYAGDAGAAGIYKWIVGQSSSEPWTQIDLAPGASSYAITGVAMESGILYAYSASASDNDTDLLRNNSPFIPPTPPPFDVVAITGKEFTATPHAVQISATDTYVKLWGIDQAPTTDVLYSYMDTLATAAPTLSSPEDGYVATVNPISGGVASITFTWPSVSGVSTGTTDAYEIDIALDADFANLVSADKLDADAGATQAENTGGLSVVFNPGSTYYWKVKVCSPVSSPWSEVRTINVEATGVLTPTIGSPENGASVATATPGFSWTPVAEATLYEFQLATDPTFSDIIYTVESATTAASPDSALADGTYYWRVRAIAPAESEWSPVATVVVAVAAAAAEGEVTVTVPDIVIPDIQVPQATVVVEDTGEATPVISEGLLWAVIIIGAVLVIAVIVLIVRTRRNV